MSARPPPADDFLEGENEVQRNIRLKACAYCKTPGAKKKCNGCRQRTYCNKKWPKERLEDGAPRAVREAAASVCAAACWVGGSQRGGRRDRCCRRRWRCCSGGRGGGGAAADDDEFAHPCPVCLDNEDDADVDGHEYGVCSACGQMYCGACTAGGLADRSPNCPTCRAPLIVSDEQHFKRFWKLVHDGF
jgi:hypothetical protein